MAREYRIGLAILGGLAIAFGVVGYRKLFRNPLPSSAVQAAPPRAIAGPSTTPRDQQVAPARATLSASSTPSSVVRALATSEAAPSESADEVPRQSFMPDFPQEPVAGGDAQQAAATEQSLDPGATRSDERPEQGPEISPVTSPEPVQRTLPQIEAGTEVPIESGAIEGSPTEPTGEAARATQDTSQNHAPPAIEPAPTRRPPPRVMASRLKKQSAPTDYDSHQPMPAATSQRKYKVQSGDTLFDIAREELGDAIRWTELYELNHGVLSAGIESLEPGLELLLPDAVARGTEDASLK